MTSRTSLRERHAALTRSVILDVARRRFAEAGYAATSVRPIADEAGVAIQTLYSAFGSKQGLLLALVDTVREQTGGEDTRGRIAGSDDPVEIAGLAAGIRRRIMERCGDIVITFREGAAGDPDVAAAYEEGRRRSREGILNVCARIEALGALRPELTVERAADQVAALFAAEVYEELTLAGWSPDEYEQWLVERLREALLSPDRRR
jgi:AcrR family transcriptional regulator